MEKIEIQKLERNIFRVTVVSGSTTTHEVVIPEGYYEKLTNNEVTPEVLLERSFEFLLLREPNTSILGRFELPVIARYFPDYEKKIREMIGGM